MTAPDKIKDQAEAGEPSAAGTKRQDAGVSKIEVDKDTDVARLRKKLQWNRDQLAEARVREEADKARIAELTASIRSLAGDGVADPLAGVLARERRLQQLRKLLAGSRMRQLGERRARQEIAGELTDLRDHVSALDAGAAQAQQLDAGMKDRLDWNRAQLKLERQRTADLRGEVDDLLQQLKGGRLEVGDVRPDSIGAFPDVADRISLSVFGDELRRGASAEEAVLAGVRSLLNRRNWEDARAIATAAFVDPSLETAGRLGLALCFHNDHLHRETIDILDGVDVDLVRRHIRVEWVRSLYHLDVDAARPKALAALAADASGGPSPLDQLAIAQIACSFQDWLVVEAALGDRSSPAMQTLSRMDLEAWEWLAGWAARRAAEGAGAQAVERPVITVTDYKSPDFYKTSTNIGDYVQTLSFLGHLSRYTGVTYVGDERLTGFMSKLGRRIDPAREIDDVGGEIQLVAVNRDASSLQAPPAGAWHFAFGWHAHPWYRGHMDFPFAEGIRPIFVSFHVNNQKLVTAEGVDYLKRYGPIGCRDWETVHFLLGLGVPAFFSGCVTTTVSNVCRKPPARRVELGSPRRTCYVDAVIPPGTQLGPRDAVMAQVYDWVRHTDLVDNLDKAVERLDRYAAKFDRMVTSRLHCALPCRSMDVETDFQPTEEADIRFEGLDDLTGPRLHAVAAAIEDKLSAVIRLIAAGAAEDAVYARWRELCAEDVEAAMQRAAKAARPLEPTLQVDALTTALRQNEIVATPAKARPPIESRIELAFVCDAFLKDYLGVVLLSAIRGASRPVRAWILTRGFSEADCRFLAQSLPEAELHFLPVDDVAYGDVNLLSHTTISTMDRLLLPSLLSEIDRIVYIDVDTLVLGDVAELFDLELGSARIGAAVSSLAVNAFGQTNVYRPSLQLPKDAARVFRSQAHAAGVTFAPPFNAGVLVMDLAAMRQDQFCERVIPFAGRNQLNDQEALNFYVANNRADLPEGWNVFPSQQIIQDPKLIHWIGSKKPWQQSYVLFRELWLEAQAAWRERCAANDPA